MAGELSRSIMRRDVSSGGANRERPVAAIQAPLVAGQSQLNRSSAESGGNFGSARSFTRSGRSQTSRGERAVVLAVRATLLL
jgi:hypothetical protein